MNELLARTAALHRHLCPRQVLGVRIGLSGGRLLGLSLPRSDKRLLVIAETDGCAVDGISVATGCTVGHRTLRIEDYGKLAATFVDTVTGTALRVAPRRDIRERALAYAGAGTTRWEAQLSGYQRMPDDELLHAEEVRLAMPIERIVSRPRLKAICSGCGEEVNNEREVVLGGVPYCRACAGHSYYEPLEGVSAAPGDAVPGR